jgi:hypothetical protein
MRWIRSLDGCLADWGVWEARGDDLNDFAVEIDALIFCAVADVHLRWFVNGFRESSASDCRLPRPTGLPVGG